MDKKRDEKNKYTYNASRQLCKYPLNWNYNQ